VLVGLGVGGLTVRTVTRMISPCSRPSPFDSRAVTLFPWSNRLNYTNSVLSSSKAPAVVYCKSHIQIVSRLQNWMQNEYKNVRHALRPSPNHRSANRVQPQKCYRRRLPGHCTVTFASRCLLLIPNIGMSLMCSPHFFSVSSSLASSCDLICHYQLTLFVHHSFVPTFREQFTEVIAIKEAFLTSLQY